MASSDELQGLSRSEVLKASPRMFEPNLLDKLSRVHPAVPPILFGPIIVFMIVEGIIQGAGWLTPVWVLGGYLFYDMLHYHVHHHRPKTALGKRLRELHMRHHFQNHERGYGVSAPFWDHVFGTAPAKKR